MDYKDLTALLVKVGGAFLLFYGLSWLPWLIGDLLKDPDDWRGALRFSGPWFTPIALGMLIFLFPTAISNKLIGGKKLDTNFEIVRALELVALRLIGVFFLFRAVSDLIAELAKVYLTFPFFEADGVPLPSTPWTANAAGNVVAFVVEIGLALWLIFGARVIARSVDRNKARD